MKRFAFALALLAGLALPVAAQEYYDVDVDLPSYPEMQPIADSPVYYAPGVDSNYFFYDGLYWDFYNDGWYSSPWYNGPWTFVDPVYVPTYVLWVPISYYHRPPHYFHGWNPQRPPRWGEHWGRDWQQRHNRIYAGRAAGIPARAPLPQYQRQYTRDNYPRGAQQGQIHGQNYGYLPRENVVRQHYQQRGITASQQLQRLPPAQPQNPSSSQAPPRGDGGPREQRR